MIILGAISTALVLYYAVYLWRSAFHYRAAIRENKTEQNVPLPFVSVIIPARNEARSVAGCVISALSQDYPADRFEVLLVNDHSEDQTVPVARNAARHWGNFRVLNLAKIRGVAYKKSAVATGIAQAKGEIILTTDADCLLKKSWISTMVGAFSEKTGLVSGPVCLESDSVFGHFQALEFMGLNAVGAAAIHAGQPTLCNGANLAYRKSVFQAVGGFAGIDHIASGDDELLMHKIASETDWEVVFAANKGAIVRTDALRRWSAFRSQRIRWVSKSTQYKRVSITATLVIAWLGMAGFPVLLIASFFDPAFLYFFFCNLLLKIAGEFPILFSSASFFDKLHLLRYLVPEQIAHIAYVLWVGLAGNAKSYTWKGREVK